LPKVVVLLDGRRGDVPEKKNTRLEGVGRRGMAKKDP